jgi:probable H4MPT-linked C1 transfer pathway protein
MKRVLGLDIGGANLKMAHHTGPACTVPFELWKHPEQLPAALSSLTARAPAFDEIAVTMTGELCDCFQTKREGVRAILDACSAVRGCKRVRVWRNDGRFVDVDTAYAAANQIAAANWLALATFAGRFARTGTCVLIDVGSTTTDIIPLRDGLPVPSGRTDPQRLQSRELVYTGVRRTPICALLGQVGGDLQVAREVFATTLDAYLLLGHIAENADDHGTADGRAATKSFAHARLSRMCCADTECFSMKEARHLARLALVAQLRELTEALCAVVWHGRDYPNSFVLAGSGEFLARRIVNDYDRTARIADNGMQPWWYRCPPQKVPAKTPRPRQIWLSARLGPARSSAACAFAVAVLAAERSNEQ